MKILVDSDCIIKLTKSSIKEVLCKSVSLFICQTVKKEVVDEGKKKGCKDASNIEQNIQNKNLKLIKDIHHIEGMGELELVALFEQGGYDAIASDDSKFIRKLEKISIPFFTPATIIVLLSKTGKIQKQKAKSYLEKLKTLVSDDEYFTSLYFIQKEK